MLVAQKSIIGYLVSGPLIKTNGSKPKSPSHVMKIACRQDNCLNEKLIGFGTLVSSEYLTKKSQCMTNLLIV